MFIGLQAFLPLKTFLRGISSCLLALLFIFAMHLHKGITWESTDYTSMASKFSRYL